jgi:hypothetical protein
MHPLLLLSFLASALSVPLSQEVAPSWVKTCGGTYLFSQDKTSWSEAYAECELYGGHIAQIDGFEENFCLLEYAQKERLPFAWYWHSGNDISSEGVWRQYDNQMILWSPWFWDGRNGGRASNCAVVDLSEGDNAGEWGDAPCTHATKAHPYICERATTTTTTDTATTEITTTPKTTTTETASEVTTTPETTKTTEIFTTTATTTTPTDRTTIPKTSASEVTTTPQPTTPELTGCKDQTCISDGLFPGPELCSPDFCQCSWGVPQPQICQEGLVFNPSVGVCDWPWNNQDCTSTN